MPEWIAKAKNKIRRKNQDTKPQPFEQQCLCGAKLVGNREEEYQVLACHDCGRQHLILPRNNYPKPIKQKKKKRNREPGMKRVANGIRRIAGRMSQSVSRNAVDVGTQTAIKGRITVVRVRRFFTPFRTIVLSIVGVALLTTVYSIRSSIREKAKTQLRESVLAAEAALEKNDLAAVAEQYQLAADALDTLNRNEPADLKIRQLARESVAIANLCPSGLLDIAEDGRKYLSQGKQSEWETHFNTIYKDQWIVIDTTVQLVNTSGQEPEYHIQIPLWVNDVPIEIDTAPAVLDQLDWTRKPNQRVIFAAQLANCWLEPGGEESWKFAINTETAFLWMHVNMVDGLGIEFDDWYPKSEVVAVLNRQAATQRIVAENE